MPDPHSIIRCKSTKKYNGGLFFSTKKELISDSGFQIPNGRLVTGKK